MPGPSDEDAQYFDSEQVFHELNYECNDIGEDSSSDVDENEVGLKIKIFDNKLVRNHTCSWHPSDPRGALCQLVAVNVL